MKPLEHSRWDTGSVIRLLAVLGSVGLYLSLTQWAEHLELAFILILAGVLIGAFVGTSRFTSWESTGFAFVLGTSFVYFFGASVLSIPANLLNRQFNLVLILGQGITELIHHQPVSNSLLFLVAVMTTCWYLGYFGGFSLIRKDQPWIPIGLAGIAIVIIDLFLTSSRRNGTISAIFFFFLMILISRMFFSYSKEKWKKERIHYDAEARFDFNRLVIFVSLFIVVIAWTIPTAIKAFTPGTVEQLKFHAYMEKLTQQWNNLFAPLNQSGNLTVYSYDDLLAIGSTTSSSEKTVFSVQTEFPPPTGTHYYWRARSYDSYDGNNWLNADTSHDSYSAGNELSPAPNLLNAELVRFTFRTNARIGIFFQGGMPGRINQSGMEIFNPTSDNEKDIVAVVPGKIIEDGTLYSTYGWVISPTIAEMKSSSTVYPAWIANRYLSISPTIPERVKELATSITAGSTDPYSKTEAITMYLRLNMHYSTSIQALPEGKDLVDWFLFDSQKGFCSQYASAEVIMLRSLGIPARLVAGYAQGAVSQNGKLYNVRLKDSHAWPEVYFVNIGWVVFEPTVIISQQLFPAGITSTEQPTPTPQPTIRVTAQSEAPVPTANQSNPVEVISGTTSGSFAWFIYLVLVLVVLGGGGILYLFVKRQREKGIRSFPSYLDDLISSSGGRTPQWIKNWENSLQMQTIEKHFRIISVELKKLHQPIRISETPQEQIKRLIALIPEIASPAQNLLREYEKSIYGGQKPSLKASQKSIHEIRGISFRYHFKQIFHKRNSAKIGKTR
jgi:hypothetical protein